MSRFEQIHETFASASHKTALLATILAAFTFGSGSLFAQEDFHNWSSFGGGPWTYSNVSTAGTVTGWSTTFAPASANVNMPAITNITITSGFTLNYPGDTIVFKFSPGYAWGKGGQLVIGNIHNYFEYSLSALDFSGTPIDVNQWNTVADYPYSWSPASKTNRTASGMSSKFAVSDPGADPGSGQGGVLWLAGLKNVGTIQLTLTKVTLPLGYGNDFILFNIATPPGPTTISMPPCTQPATDYLGKPVPATWDLANCYIKPIVTGATPFIWNNAYYVTPDKSTTCVSGAGSWDGANCYFMPKPVAGYILNDSLYVPPGFGNSCSIGVFNGTGCLVKTAPWGTHAFEWANAWYFTPLFTCKDGGYDGANCYIMRPPTGTIAFIYGNAFYYAQ